jgi:hypothetical protein
MALYPVQYIESLEARISEIEHEATLVTPEMSLAQPQSGPSRHIADSQIANAFANSQSASDHLDMAFMTPLDHSNNMMYGLDMLQSEDSLFFVSDVPGHHTTTSPVVQSDPAVMPARISEQGSAPRVADVSIHEGALFFQVYFEAIHPRYPFLDVDECNRGYQEWKAGSEGFASSSDAWRSYLVKMAREAAPSSFLVPVGSSV